MVQKIGTINGTGSVELKEIFRYEHHKFIIKVSNLNSVVKLKIYDYTLDSKVNLNSNDLSYSLFENDTYQFLSENQRMDKALIEVIEGDATIDIYYIGW